MQYNTSLQTYQLLAVHSNNLIHSHTYESILNSKDTIKVNQDALQLLSVLILQNISENELFTL
jgi:hypothetical protein